MKTCATCKFMAATRAHENTSLYRHVDDPPYLESSPHSTCVRIIHGNNIENKDRAWNEPAAVVDGSGYAARLLVLPTFGCVLHEEKP